MLQYEHFQASSSLFNDQVGRTEYRQMRMVNNGTVCQYKEERNDFISDDIFRLDTSSVDSAADYPRGSSESPQSIRTTNPQHQQRSRAAPRKFQPNINSIKVVAQDKVRELSCSRTWMDACLYWDVLKLKQN